MSSYAAPVSSFTHERLIVYESCLDFVALAGDTIEVLPRGRSHLADQLTRASISIVLNIAEGCGKFSRDDKRWYYLSALGSTTECAAILDIALRLKVVAVGAVRTGRRLRRRRGRLGRLDQAHELLAAL